MVVALAFMMATAALPLHVPTWAYVGGRYAYAAGAPLVQRYVTYAESGGAADRGVERDCPPEQSGCTPVMYFDANIIFVPRDPGCRSGPQALFASAPDFAERWMTHVPGGDAAAARVHIIKSDARYFCGGQADVLYPNVAVPSVARWWRRYFDTEFPQRNTILFNDDAPFNVADHYYKAGLTHSAEFADDGSFVSANAAFSMALAPHRLFWNAIGPGGGYFTQRDVAQQLASMLSVVPPNVLGYVSEDAMYNATNRTISAYNARGVLDAASTIERSTAGSVVVLDDGDGEARGAVDDQIRRVHTALYWLLADGARAIDWENIANGSTQSVGIYPEETIVPSRPLVTMDAFHWGGSSNGSGCGNGSAADRGGAKALVVACGTSGAYNATGVYVREFAACATAGRPTGPCAAILNTSDQPAIVSAAWLHRTYRRNIAWMGEALRVLRCPACDGSLEAGTTFEPNKTVIPARDALLLTADGGHAVAGIRRNGSKREPERPKRAT